MGKKLPLLKPREVQANLRALGFVHRRTVGSHEQWVREADGRRQRAVVTVDVGKRQFTANLMKSMIRQSLCSRDEFCTGIMEQPAPPQNQSRKRMIMPNYKNPGFFNQRPTDGNFDIIYHPGAIAPWSGIYRCTSCGFEVVSTQGFPLPPTVVCTNHSSRWRCNHGPVRWQLAAAAIHVTVNA
jgi:predicted RNA binding protein YcfA (HicA-like mRNA interferase family)